MPLTVSPQTPARFPYGVQPAAPSAHAQPAVAGAQNCRVYHGANLAEAFKLAAADHARLGDLATANDLVGRANEAGKQVRGWSNLARYGPPADIPAGHQAVLPSGVTVAHLPPGNSRLGDPAPQDHAAALVKAKYSGQLASINDPLKRGELLQAARLEVLQLRKEELAKHAPGSPAASELASRTTEFDHELEQIYSDQIRDYHQRTGSAFLIHSPADLDVLRREVAFLQILKSLSAPSQSANPAQKSAALATARDMLSNANALRGRQLLGNSPVFAEIEQFIRREAHGAQPLPPGPPASPVDAQDSAGRGAQPIDLGPAPVVERDEDADAAAGVSIDEHDLDLRLLRLQYGEPSPVGGQHVDLGQPAPPNEPPPPDPGPPPPFPPDGPFLDPSEASNQAPDIPVAPPLHPEEAPAAGADGMSRGSGAPHDELAAKLKSRLEKIEAGAAAITAKPRHVHAAASPVATEKVSSRVPGNSADEAPLMEVAASGKNIPVAPHLPGSSEGGVDASAPGAGVPFAPPLPPGLKSEVEASVPDASAFDARPAIGNLADEIAAARKKMFKRSSDDKPAAKQVDAPPTGKDPKPGGVRPPGSKFTATESPGVPAGLREAMVIRRGAIKEESAEPDGEGGADEAPPPAAASAENVPVAPPLPAGSDGVVDASQPNFGVPEAPPLPPGLDGGVDVSQPAATAPDARPAVSNLGDEIAAARKKMAERNSDNKAAARQADAAKESAVKLGSGQNREVLDALLAARAEKQEKDPDWEP